MSWLRLYSPVIVLLVGGLGKAALAALVDSAEGATLLDAAVLVLLGFALLAHGREQVRRRRNRDC